MTWGAGVLRDEERLAATEQALAGLAADDAAGARPGPEAWETTGLHAVATVLAHAARLRCETRGSHWRTDLTERDERWQVRLVVSLDADGRLRHREEPVTAT